MGASSNGRALSVFLGEPGIMEMLVEGHAIVNSFEIWPARLFNEHHPPAEYWTRLTVDEEYLFVIAGEGAVESMQVYNVKRACNALVIISAARHQRSIPRKAVLITGQELWIGMLSSTSGRLLLVQGSLEAHPGTNGGGGDRSKAPLKLEAGLRRYFPDADAPSFMYGEMTSMQN